MRRLFLFLVLCSSVCWAGPTEDFDRLYDQYRDELQLYYQNRGPDPMFTVGDSIRQFEVRHRGTDEGARALLLLVRTSYLNHADHPDAIGDEAAPLILEHYLNLPTLMC